MTAAWEPDAGAGGGEHPDDFDLPEPEDVVGAVPDDDRTIDGTVGDRTAPLDEPLDVPEADALDQRDVVVLDDDRDD